MTDRHTPLAGRRLYFVGIGGSGMSAYANVARAWGAEVRGWDVHETIFTRTLEGVELDLGSEPRPPAGFEVVVSTGHRVRIDGTSRAAFLAELVALRPSIVVTGAHGKTTTTGMIAHALRTVGNDPSFVVGGVIPQLGGNAGTGEGWLVVEGDESDRSVFELRPEIAVVTNVELDHHAAYGSENELAEVIDDWLSTVPEVVRGWELEPVSFTLAVPGEHNRRNAATALETLVRVGVDRAAAEAALAAFTGAERRFELVGERGGVTVIDDYGHNPTELRAALATARERDPRRLVALYVPHVVERTRQLHRELGEALGLADVAIVTDFVGQRDASRPGVGARLVLDAVPDPTRRVWAKTLDDAARLALALVRPGDTVLTLGVGEPWRAAQAIHRGLATAVAPDSAARHENDIRLETGVALSRLTTIGTGGVARAFSKVTTETELETAVRWAAERGLEVLPIGLGSNVLAADAGVDGLVVRLEGALAAVQVEGRVLAAGGGAANAVCLHRSRAAGLGGLEFACAIPGTAGGGVWMNAGAYGSDWKAILVRALVASADGTGWLSASELGLEYRRSGLRRGQVVARVEYRLEPRSVDEIKATVADLVARRKATQPTNRRTFGSVFKNPPGALGAGRMLELCGLKGHRIGGALVSPRHANFIENAGEATSADCLALIAEARRRAGERFGVELEHEVVLLGSFSDAA